MEKKRIVIKIGTNLLTKETPAGTVGLNKKYITKISGQIAELHQSGNEIILVTSGAISAGAGKLRLKGRPKSLPEKQSAAAVGQPLLMAVYDECFQTKNISTAQLLLTREDFENRMRYINTRNTILSLLQQGVVPIINENDTVSVEEIQFGDNDTLASLVAIKVEADLLIILTDVEGLCTGDPNRDRNVKCINEVKKITSEIEEIARKTIGSDYGSGGMCTKVQAAKVATTSGVETVIADGRKDEVLKNIIEGKTTGTRFHPQEKIVARKRWIAFGMKTKGMIMIDDGAVEAITKKCKSLLPSGIISVEGEYSVGESVSIMDKANNEIARGLTNYSSNDINKIKGKKSGEIKKILGVCDFEEVVHRDNLVVL